MVITLIIYSPLLLKWVYILVFKGFLFANLLLLYYCSWKSPSLQKVTGLHLQSTVCLSVFRGSDFTKLLISLSPNPNVEPSKINRSRISPLKLTMQAFSTQLGYVFSKVYVSKTSEWHTPQSGLISCVNQSCFI